MYIVLPILFMLFAALGIWLQIHTGAAWWGDFDHMIERKRTPGHFWTIIVLWGFFGVVANAIILAWNLGFR